MICLLINCRRIFNIKLSLKSWNKNSIYSHNFPKYIPKNEILAVKGAESLEGETKLIQYHLTYVHFHNNFHFIFPFKEFYMRREIKYFFQFHELWTEREGNKDSFHGALKMLFCWWWCMNIKNVFPRSAFHRHGNSFKLKSHDEEKEWKLWWFLFRNSFASQNVTNVDVFSCFLKPNFPSAPRVGCVSR